MKHLLTTTCLLIAINVAGQTIQELYEIERAKRIYQYLLDNDRIYDRLQPEEIEDQQSTGEIELISLPYGAREWNNGVEIITMYMQKRWTKKGEYIDGYVVIINPTSGEPLFFKGINVHTHDGVPVESHKFHLLGEPKSNYFQFITHSHGDGVIYLNCDCEGVQIPPPN